MSEKWFEIQYWKEITSFAVIGFLAIAAVGIWVVERIREAVKRYKKKKERD